MIQGNYLPESINSLGTRGIIGIPRRSCADDIAKSRAIRLAMYAARGITDVLPVVFWNKIIGLVQGYSEFSNTVRFIPINHTYKFGWTNYDAMINDITVNNKIYNKMWSKTYTSAPVANTWSDLWCVTGNPTAGSIANTANTATQFSDATAGSIYHGGNVSTDKKFLMSHWHINSAVQTSLLLVDRVLAYDQNTHSNTATTTMTNTLTAQRYNGSGLPGMKISCTSGPTVQGSTATNLSTLTYVNNSGTTHTVPTTPTLTFIPSAAAATTTLGAKVICPNVAAATTTTFGPFLPLASGDQGARSVTSYVTSSANTGNMTFSLVKPLAFNVTASTGVMYETDSVYQMPVLERIYDGACLEYFVFHPTATAFTIWGGIRVAWGA